MTTGIERIAIKARRERNGTFTSLLHHLTPALVRKHLYKMKSNTASGVDRESLEGAKKTFDDWVAERISSIHRKGYRASPVRRVYIPKPGSSKQRPLGVPTVSDRAIQGAVSEILSQIYEVDFLKQSFGGRPGVGAHHAVVNLQNTILKEKTKYILNCDLENFFGSVDHGWVMRFLSHRVKDPRILNLIQRWLRAGVIEKHMFTNTSKGVPQGGPISVLISNLYLHYTLDLWLEHIVKPRMKGKMEFIRYLDDCVLLFQEKSDMEKARIVLNNRLSKFSLKLNEDKTKAVCFGRNAGATHGTLNYLGFSLYRTKNRKGRYKIGIKTEKARLHRAMQKVKTLIRSGRHAPIPVQHQRIVSFLRGHFNYYGVGNNDDCLWAIQRVVFKYWRKQLCRRSQKGRYLWTRYLRLLKFFPLCPVRLKIPYRDYSLYQIL